MERGLKAVVEQHWRQEEDGTFVVFMHSVKHHAARPPPRRWFSWYRPIRAQVRCRGVTAPSLYTRLISMCVHLCTPRACLYAKLIGLIHLKVLPLSVFGMQASDMAT